MKKIIKPKSIIFILAFSFLFAFFGVMVNAYSQSGITSLDVKSGNLQITVSGTTEDDLTAVSISVYKSDGSTLVKMKTSSVSDENKFSETIPLDAGKYTVKVANYDGGQIITKENVIVKKITDTNIEDETEKQKAKNETTKTKKISNKEDLKKSSETNSGSSLISKNPKTSDNITILASIFATCSLGSLAIFKFRKKEK